LLLQCMAREAEVSTLNKEVAMLKCEKAVLLHANQDSLTAASWKQLEDVILKRSLVTLLKLELETATMGAIKLSPRL
jgi:hypothetical protein